jgi:hypothetical protein
LNHFRLHYVLRSSRHDNLIITKTEIFHFVLLFPYREWYDVLTTDILNHLFSLLSYKSLVNFEHFHFIGAFFFLYQISLVTFHVSYSGFKVESRSSHEFKGSQVILSRNLCEVTLSSEFGSFHFVRVILASVSSSLFHNLSHHQFHGSISLHCQLIFAHVRSRSRMENGILSFLRRSVHSVFSR